MRQEADFVLTKGVRVHTSKDDVADLKIRKLEYDRTPVRSFSRPIPTVAEVTAARVMVYISANQIVDAGHELLHSLVIVSITACVLATAETFLPRAPAVTPHTSVVERPWGRKPQMDSTLPRSTNRRKT